MQIHSDDVRQARLAHHLSQELCDDAASLPHLALLAVREVRDHTDDRAG